MRLSHTTRRARRTRGPLLALALLGAPLGLGCNESGTALELDYGVPSSIFTSCVEPDRCLAVAASWCVPESDGSVSCAPNDVDLSLFLPGGDPVVGFRDGQVSQASGCVHGGDEEAFIEPLDRDGDGQPGPFTEHVTCSPVLGGSGPATIVPGLYRAEVRDQDDLLDTGIVVVDVNVDGAHERAVFLVIDEVPGSYTIEYP